MLRRLALCSLALSACFVDTQPSENGGETGATESTSGGASTSTTGASGISASFTETGPTSVSATTNPATTDTEPDTDSSPTQGETTESADESTADSSSSSGEDVLSVAMLNPGDLLITEVMVNPQCNPETCEWFEIYNATDQTIDLQGLGVGDHDNDAEPSPDGLIAVSVLLAAGDIAVLVKDPTDWPYPRVEYLSSFGQPSFNNGSAERVYIFGPNDLVLDRTPSFFSNNATEGRSFILRSEHWDADDNDLPDNWCLSDDPLPTDAFGEEWGTPGTDVVNCFDEI